MTPRLAHGAVTFHLRWSETYGKWCLSKAAKNRNIAGFLVLTNVKGILNELLLLLEQNLEVVVSLRLSI